MPEQTDENPKEKTKPNTITNLKKLFQGSKKQKEVQQITSVASISEETHKPLGREIQPIVDIKAKEKEILKKRERFRFLMFVMTILIFLLILSPTAVRFYKENFVKTKPVVQDVDDENKKPPIEIIDPESIVEYSNNDLRISLEHLRKAVLVENIEEIEKTKKIEISYDKSGSGENITIENLTEGYIFRISTFSTYLRNIDEITQVKKDSLKIECPETATMTNTVGEDVDGIEGRTFEVINCGADYKLTYVVKNNLNYEFAQIFRGDLGYRQAYKAETENILRSIKFYPDVIPDPGPIETYNSEQYKLSFEYPRSLDSKCCNITGPISTSSTILLTLGDSEASTDSSNFDVIGFFVENKVVDDFNTYLEKQKNLLTDDYVVTKGESPKPEIRTIKVGDRDGTMLRDYSWKENDLIYVDISKGDKTHTFLVISIRNVSGEVFEKVVDSVLESFVFY